jgi:uncharacterized protein YdeI (YjbR/CyaY-like superfamily)
MGAMPQDKEPTLAFKTPKAFEAWIKKQKPGGPGLWLRLYKKASGVPSLTYAEALDVALCYGWIDAQKKSYDEQSWIQRFCPRRPRGMWSKINTEHVERLIKAKRMRPAGLAQVEAAKADGRWDRAYQGAKDSPMPADFLSLLAKDKKALAFFKTLNASNSFAIRHRLNTAAKPETRERRLQLILAMMKAGKKFH